MSFSIILQNNQSPINKIGKSIATIKSLSGELRNETDILNPEIRIECEKSDIVNCNYCTISEFGRKYFVKEIESLRNQVYILKAHVDVLDSFSSEILSNTAVILRQENNFNLLLNDGVFKCTQNPRIFYRDFPAGLGQFNYILLAQGGE